MKITSSIPLYILTLAMLAPLPSYAELVLPYWLSPKWIQRKLSDFHTQNLARYENTQSNASTTGKEGAQNVGQQNAPYSPDQPTNASSNSARSTNKNAGIKAPVETAQPKMNEKYLTPEELKELRRQLRQPR